MCVLAGCPSPTTAHGRPLCRFSTFSRFTFFIQLSQAAYFHRFRYQESLTRHTQGQRRSTEGLEVYRPVKRTNSRIKRVRSTLYTVYLRYRRRDCSTHRTVQSFMSIMNHLFTSTTALRQPYGTPVHLALTFASAAAASPALLLQPPLTRLLRATLCAVRLTPPPRLLIELARDPARSYARSRSPRDRREVAGRGRVEAG